MTDRHEKLCNERDDAADAEKRIKDAAATLKNKLQDLVNAFCEEHDADYSSIYGYIDDLVSDLEFDACGPHYRRRVYCEDEIGRLDDADLRRNSPVRL